MVPTLTQIYETIISSASARLVKPSLVKLKRDAMARWAWPPPALMQVNEGASVPARYGIFTDERPDIGGGVGWGMKGSAVNGPPRQPLFPGPL